MSPYDIVIVRRLVAAATHMARLEGREFYRYTARPWMEPVSQKVRAVHAITRGN